MYICILHLCHICVCISSCNGTVLVALVTGHYTWTAGHVPYAFILGAFIHCTICTLQGGFTIQGYWALLKDWASAARAGRKLVA